MTTSPGKYCAIASGEGYLNGFESLVEQDRETALRCADERIDAELIEWDRDLWTPATTPPDVYSVARLIAEARYLRLNLSRSSPFNEAATPLADRLEADADASIQRITSRGWVLGTDGQRQYARDDTVRPMFASVGRG